MECPGFADGYEVRSHGGSGFNLSIHLGYGSDFIFYSFVGHGCRWLASIYCPSLVALEKVVVSRLLESLQSIAVGWSTMPLGREFQDFDSVTAKER